MESLKERFLYDFNPEMLSSLFELLFKELKVKHLKNKYIPELNMGNIIVDKEITFDNVQSTDNIEKEKGENIRALAKIMIGCFLSQGVYFNDLSRMPDTWFEEHLTEMFGCINYEDVDEEYFRSVLIDKKNYYYSDYLQRKRQKKQLEGADVSEIHESGIRLTKNNGAASKSIDEDAKLQALFNPLLIGFSVAIISVIILMVILLN